MTQRPSHRAAGIRLTWSSARHCSARVSFDSPRQFHVTRRTIGSSTNSSDVGPVWGRIIVKPTAELVLVAFGCWDLEFLWGLEVGIWNFMKRQFDPHQFELGINRRTFLGQAAFGLGGLALACLADPDLLRASDAPAANTRWKGIVDPTHFPVRAR